MIHEYTENNETRKHRIYGGMVFAALPFPFAIFALFILDMTVGLRHYMVMSVIILSGAVSLAVFIKTMRKRVTIQLLHDCLVILNRGKLKGRYSLHEPFEFVEHKGSLLELQGHTIKASGKNIAFIPVWAQEDYVLLKNGILKLQAEDKNQPI